MITTIDNEKQVRLETLETPLISLENCIDCNSVVDEKTFNKNAGLCNNCKSDLIFDNYLLTI